MNSNNQIELMIFVPIPHDFGYTLIHFGWPTDPYLGYLPATVKLLRKNILK
jgi:hypothetical protein